MREWAEMKKATPSLGGSFCLIRCGFEFAFAGSQ
jgi:hypothetical protein